MSAEFRESLILTLGQAEGQPWASLAEAPSMGEFMYGAQADALIAGPLAGLLAEVERHRAGREVEQEMLRNAIEMLSELDSLRAENERLRGDVEFHAKIRLRVEAVLDAALGTEDEDGAGAGLAADVQLLADQRDRLRAQVEAVRELAQRGTGTDLTPTMLDGVTTNAMWVYDYLQRLDVSWRDRLRAILNAADGGGSNE